MFSAPPTAPLIAVYGSEASSGRGVGLWSSGYAGNLSAAGARPIMLEPNTGGESWAEVLGDAKGVIACGFDPNSKLGDLESLCLWCKKHRFPLLAIDQGILALNAAFGGLNYTNLSKEFPEALQHRHPPEHGLRHAILIPPGNKMSIIYGEGEIVVNSEHRQAVQKVAPGFQIGATALDGVIEAIESTTDWFALGVQWQPASGSASGLDIQIFRALLDAVNGVETKAVRKPRRYAMAS